MNKEITFKFTSNYDINTTDWSKNDDVSYIIFKDGYNFGDYLRDRGVAYEAENERLYFVLDENNARTGECYFISSIEDTDEMENNPIKELRIYNKLTQKELSEACFNIPLRTIQDWENGRRQPPLYVVMLIIARLESLGLLKKKLTRDF